MPNAFKQYQSTSRYSVSRISSRWLRSVAGSVLATFACYASAGPVRSVGAMTFVDTQTLVVADWRGDELHALRLAPVTRAAPGGV